MSVSALFSAGSHEVTLTWRDAERSSGGLRAAVRAGIIRDCKPAGIRRGEEREHEQAAAESPGEEAPALTATH